MVKLFQEDDEGYADVFAAFHQEETMSLVQAGDEKDFPIIDPTVAKAVAKRFNEGKPKLGYVLYWPHFLEAFARVCENGEIKYGQFNWKKGGKPDEEYLHSAVRHIVAVLDGEDFDEEYGTHHLAHAAWNIMTWMDLNRSDKIVSSNFAELRKALEEKYARPTYTWGSNH